MLHIISDSSALYTIENAKKAGFESVPLNIIFDSETYRDLEDLTPQEFIDLCNKGIHPKSSQPSVGEKLDLYNRILEDEDAEILDITIMSAISGAWQSSQLAKVSCKDPERVYIVDSRTLCGGQQALVEYALKLKNNGVAAAEIISQVEKMAGKDIGTVVCPDMSFLERGGRVSKLAGKAGSLLKLMPIVKKEIDRDGLGVLNVARTFKGSYRTSINYFKENHVTSDWVFYITHGANEVEALKAKQEIENAFEGAKVIVEQISLLFMVHGGPGCVAIQATPVKTV